PPPDVKKRQDIMSEALNLAKLRMNLKVFQINYNLGLEIYEKNKLNLFKKNSLLITELNELFENNEIEGFDLIIGNPPYVEYSKIKNYELTNFKSLKSGNIYAFMTEKTIDLLKQEGVLGLIVPISIISTRRMESIRNFLEIKCNNIFISSFSDRPGTLFNGVHQKLSIIIGRRKDSKYTSIYTTSYKHWYEEERKELFHNLQFIKNTFIENSYIPKIGNSIESEIYNKLRNNTASLVDLTFPNSEYSLSLSTRLTFWVKAFIGNVRKSEYKTFDFVSKKQRDVFYLIVNSDIFFFFWEMVSDGWHITKKELIDLQFNYEEFEALSEDKVSYLVDLLQTDIENNKEFIGSKQVDYVYKHKKSKRIIEKINYFLAPIFNLDVTEIEYIKHYNIKVRLNDEYEVYKRMS
ncbi:Eco57I restriction-modification methylase domain-containing protein, partial [Staphylococcus pasteuri]|uniref:Eco57I restriction-modification methylase domain-containing protein n=1 Tax=Staphylococcus pasteuri TaxID=45972 RepID=UPI0034C6A9C3